MAPVTIIILLAEFFLLLGLFYGLNKLYAAFKSKSLDKLTGYIFSLFFIVLAMFVLPFILNALSSENLQYGYSISFYDADAVRIVKTSETILLTNIQPDILIAQLSCNDCTYTNHYVVESNKTIVIAIDNYNFDNITITDLSDNSLLGIIE